MRGPRTPFSPERERTFVTPPEMNLERHAQLAGAMEERRGAALCKSAMHKIWNLYKKLAFSYFTMLYAVNIDVMVVTELTLTNDIKNNMSQHKTVASISAKQHNVYHTIFSQQNTKTDNCSFQ